MILENTLCLCSDEFIINKGETYVSKQIVTSAMDSSAPAPAPSLNPESASAVFTVDGVYNVTNVGTAFTGIVSKGTIRLGDKA